MTADVAKEQLHLTFVLAAHVYTLYGNAFDGVTPANRINKKFKCNALSHLIDE